MKALRIFCLGGLLLLYAQVGLGQDSIRTEHLQEVKVNARQHRILTSTSPLQLLDKGDMLRLGVTDMADALHRMPGINLRDYGGAGGQVVALVREEQLLDDVARRRLIGRLRSAQLPVDVNDSLLLGVAGKTTGMLFLQFLNFQPLSGRSFIQPMRSNH